MAPRRFSPTTDGFVGAGVFAGVFIDDISAAHPTVQPTDVPIVCC